MATPTIFNWDHRQQRDIPILRGYPMRTIEEGEEGSGNKHRDQIESPYSIPGKCPLQRIEDLTGNVEKHRSTIPLKSPPQSIEQRLSQQPHSIVSKHVNLEEDCTVKRDISNPWVKDSVYKARVGEPRVPNQSLHGLQHEALESKDHRNQLPSQAKEHKRKSTEHQGRIQSLQRLPRARGNSEEYRDQQDIPVKSTEEYNGIADEHEGQMQNSEEYPDLKDTPVQSIEEEFREITEVQHQNLPLHQISDMLPRPEGPHEQLFEEPSNCDLNEHVQEAGPSVPIKGPPAPLIIKRKPLPNKPEAEMIKGDEIKGPPAPFIIKRKPLPNKPEAEMIKGDEIKKGEVEAGRAKAEADKEEVKAKEFENPSQAPMPRHKLKKAEKPLYANSIALTFALLAASPNAPFQGGYFKRIRVCFWKTWFGKGKAQAKDKANCQFCGSPWITQTYGARCETGFHFREDMETTYKFMGEYKFPFEKVKEAKEKSKPKRGRRLIVW